MNQEMNAAGSPRLLEELQRLADAGETAGPLAHEINNFLNLLLLNVAILERKIPEELRPELQQVRRHGLAAAELVRQFQQSRRLSQGKPQSIDLHEVLHEVLTTLCGLASEPGRLPPMRVVPSGAPLDLTDSVPVIVDLAADLPPVQGWAPDLRRLLTFLVSNAVMAAAQAGGWVRVRTASGDGHVVLRVEDTGAQVEPERLAHFFDPSALGRPEVNRLELAACSNIVRRLQGKIEALPGDDVGMAVVVELKTT